MKAYHFLKHNMTAGRGNEAPWVVGETRTVASHAASRSYTNSTNKLLLAALTSEIVNDK